MCICTSFSFTLASWGHECFQKLHWQHSEIGKCITQTQHWWLQLFFLSFKHSHGRQTCIDIARQNKRYCLFKILLSYCGNEKNISFGILYTANPMESQHIRKISLRFCNCRLTMFCVWQQTYQPIACTFKLCLCLRNLD